MGGRERFAFCRMLCQAQRERGGGFLTLGPGSAEEDKSRSDRRG